MTTQRKYAVMLSLLSFSGAACVRHIYPGHGKVREYEPANYASEGEERSPGAVWSPSAANLYSDTRAWRLGDILTVRIDERADANRDATTATSRESSASHGIETLVGLMLAEGGGGLDPGELVSAVTDADFVGRGQTSRSGRFEATLPVRIRSVLPNGDFYVEGQKVVLLNEEESQIYLSGVVRPIDIEPDNTVESFRLADVELEFTGRGVITERQSPGWLARILDWVWPF